MNVYDVLAMMMKVPGHARESVFFEIDTWLSPRNRERQRALDLVKRQAPAEIHDIIGYMATTLNTERNIGEWTHTFITHQPDSIGWEGDKYFEVPCLISESAMPRIFISAHYVNAQTRIAYLQVAEFFPRRNEVNIGPVITRKMRRNEEV
jgi:hypothetical protein